MTTPSNTPGGDSKLFEENIQQPDATNVPPKEMKTFERWRKGVLYMTGQLEEADKKQYEETELVRLKQKQHKKCERWKERLIKYSPMVTFMLGNLEKQGAEFRKEHFICMECDETRCGGFSPDGFIALCQNRFISKAHMEDTMSHELIHAYDHCKYNVDWNNVYHVACTEVRAASLSGDCNWLMELRRGNFKFTKQHQACVKRRAILSLKSNPEFADEAEKAVGVVFDSCFNDTQPFNEIY